MDAFKNAPLPVQLVLTVVIVGLIVFVGYKFFPNIEDQRVQIARKEKRLNELQAEIQRGLEAEKKLDALERELEDREAQLQELKAIIPPVRNDAELVRNLESLAQQSRVRVRLVESQRLRRKEFYDEYPIGMQVQANYHDLARFFDRLAHQPRIFNVSGIRLTHDRQSDFSVAANFTALTFVYREDAPAAPAEAAPAARPAARRRS